MEDNKETAETAIERKLQAAKTIVMQQVIAEFVGENRAEIIARARARLRAMGVPLAEEESGAQS